ncbi:hypothetical protein [Arcobacter cloacae]|uniref:Uncharacterized protein n=1 Tax=Arcobacter cloacae TaxID=1054034 RepID=A0A6M8NM07_9BACT|nr:hypothetical protein [Arcobacter cloacae]QKF90250.1 hypothetical protein ACLO_1766 [Arcobacter cloacae]RXI41957.1 hypothetical protein CP963_05160 [Arcobacter cloacae]
MGMVKDALKSVFKTITILSRPYFSLEENELKFKIDSDNFYKYPISNVETKTRHDSYVLEAYTLKTKDLFIEYIHIDSDVSWNSQALGSFISLLKENLKIRNMDLLEKKEFNHYEFLTYKIDGNYILNIIYIYEINKDVFIIDKQSELYENLLKNFQKDYKYTLEKNSNLNLDINVSLVKNNAMRSYFGISS